jgi:HSP20 family molecular chaperone IbpA
MSYTENQMRNLFGNLPLGDLFNAGLQSAFTERTREPVRTTRPLMPIDVLNTDSSMYIYAEIPGVSKDCVDVDFYNNKLTITVEKNRKYDSPEMSEIKYGKAERTITLPICVTKKDTVSVGYSDGILRVKINKLLEEENKFSVKIDDEKEN